MTPPNEHTAELIWPPSVAATAFGQAEIKAVSTAVRTKLEETRPAVAMKITPYGAVAYTGVMPREVDEATTSIKPDWRTSGDFYVSHPAEINF